MTQFIIQYWILEPIFAASPLVRLFLLPTPRVFAPPSFSPSHSFTPSVCSSSAPLVAVFVTFVPLPPVRSFRPSSSPSCVCYVCPPPSPRSFVLSVLLQPCVLPSIPPRVFVPLSSSPRSFTPAVLLPRAFFSPPPLAFVVSLFFPPPFVCSVF